VQAEHKADRLDGLAGRGFLPVFPMVDDAALSELYINAALKSTNFEIDDFDVRLGVFRERINDSRRQKW